MTQQLTLIFITHNSEQVIARCLEQCRSEGFACLVVDNASTDATRELAKQAWPACEVITLPENLGYGAAANRGLAAVKTPFALLLNPDVMATPEQIKRLLELHQQHGPITISSCLIQTPAENGEMRIDYVTPIDPAQPVNWVPRVLGAVMLFDMARLPALGLFDEHIFMYYEDDELCLRARRKGERIAIFPEVALTHLAGRSSPRTLPYRKLKAWHMVWAKLYYRRLDKGFAKTLELNLAFLLRFAAKALFACLQGRREDAALHRCQWQAAWAFLTGQPSRFRLENA